MLAFFSSTQERPLSHVPSSFHLEGEMDVVLTIPQRDASGWLPPSSIEVPFLVLLSIFVGEKPQTGLSRSTKSPPTSL